MHSERQFGLGQPLFLSLVGVFVQWQLVIRFCDNHNSRSFQGLGGVSTYQALTYGFAGSQISRRWRRRPCEWHQIETFQIRSGYARDRGYLLLPLIFLPAIQDRTGSR